MLVAAPASSSPTELTSRRRRARVASERLLQRLEQEHFAGWDPYDALSSPAIRTIARTSLLRQVSIQLLKHSPVNVRPLLGIPKRRHTKALALLASAYVRLDRPSMALQLRDILLEKELPGGGWGYDFDVQTRWSYYRAGHANAVVTSFAGHALLDTLAFDDDGRVRQSFDRALDFAARNLLVRARDASFFAYFKGGRAPIHNSNLLVASLFARATDDGQREIARPAVLYTLDRQRPDGTWPYGERPGLEWVDGFHTAYVLERLAEWHAVQPEASLEAAIERGTDAYINRLIDPDGAPRATIEKRYPVDVHAAASAITALVRLQAFHARARETSESVLDWTLAHMVRPDGRFSFHHHRHWTNRTPYVRWNDAHMLLALATYLGEEAKT
jgi:hypothetical protein